jgi:hypothetical protein
MHGDTSESTPVPVRKRGRKTALITISDLDKRTGAAKRVGDLVRAIESDLGGRDHLSATQRQLVQRAAVLSAIAEDFEVRWAMGQEVDVGTHVTLINSLRRVYETIGLDRVARDVGFTIDDLAAEFAAERAVKEAAQAEADEAEVIEAGTASPMCSQAESASRHSPSLPKPLQRPLWRPQNETTPTPATEAPPDTKARPR